MRHEPIPRPADHVPERLRTHVSRREAATLCRGGVLTKWLLDEDSARPDSMVQTGYFRILDFAVSPDSEEIALSLPCPHIEIRRWSDLSLVRTLPVPGDHAPFSLAWSPDGQWLAAGDCELHVINPADGTVFARNSSDSVMAIAFSRDEDLLACCGMDQGGGFVHIFLLPTDARCHAGATPNILEGGTLSGGPMMEEAPSAMRFSESGDEILVYEAGTTLNGDVPGRRGYLHLIDLVHGATRWRLPVGADLTRGDTRLLTQLGLPSIGHSTTYLSEPVWLSCGEAACGSTNGTVFGVDTRTGRVTRRLPVGTAADVYSLALAADRSLWAALGDGTVRRVPY